MTPYYADDAVTIYHGDCREWTGTVDAVITDPPYGMSWNTDTTRFTGGNRELRRSGRDGRSDWGVIVNDDEPFDPTPWLLYPRVVLWGANHYAHRLPVGTTLVWIKKNDNAFGSFLSDAEIGWMNGGVGVYCRRDTSMLSVSRRGERTHPAEKPVGLMAWCITRAGTKGPVLDPYMGTGSTLLAAKSLGIRAIGIEIEERYCEIAANRCRQEVLGLAV